MENVVLTVHLLLALALIGCVLLQRSEGGGLGMGGGGGAISGRAAASAMTRMTWILASAFICTSIALTIIAASKSSDSSVLDRLSGASAPAATESPALPADGSGNLAAPSAPAATEGTAPLVPKAD